jgi:hypothetical protein
VKFAVALLALALAGCAGAPRPNDRYARMLTPTANPGKVVATELAFAREAQEKGQWTAFRDYAAEDAVMFVPEPVNAREWLGKQANPPEAVKWQPHEVWSSCDGSLAVTKGAWQRPNGTFGYFTTVWQRQNNGEYQWVLDQGEPLDAPLAAPEFIRTEVADCKSEPVITVHHVDLEAVNRAVESKDRTLQVEWSGWPSGRRSVAVRIMRDGESVQVFNTVVEAPSS